MFSADIESMKMKFPEFKEALEKKGDGEPAIVTVELRDLKKIAPRTTPQVRSYNRLVNYLKEVGIDLRIISQKTQTEDEEDGFNVSEDMSIISSASSEYKPLSYGRRF